MIINNNKVMIIGKLDMEKAEELKISLINVQSRFKTVFLDLSKCTYIDSTGLGVLVSIYNNMDKANNKLIIKGVRDKVKDIFNLTMLDKVFDIE